MDSLFNILGFHRPMGEYMTKIEYETACMFLMPRHYSGRIPNIRHAFGLFEDGVLQAVCTFGIPASPPLCRGIAGDKWRKNVIELNRLCRKDEYDKPLSHFVAWCLKQLKPFNYIVVSYSDTAMNHHGYIYQACNFLYTGSTKPRTDIYTGKGKHSRHYDKNEISYNVRKVRSSKYRYVYFCTENKRIKNKYLQALNYPIIKEYPKGDNNPPYILGTYLEEITYTKQ